MEYEQLLKERITGPLKMADTSIVLSLSQQQRLAQPVAGCRVALQEVLALGNPQIGKLALVARHLLLQILERRPRVLVSLRAEQQQRPREITLVTAADDLILQPAERCRGASGSLAQGKFVVDAQVGLSGA